jgi:bacillithiol system protein YtxJ
MTSPLFIWRDIEMLQKLVSIEQFDEVLQKENKFFLLKHSLTCPISNAAYNQYQEFTEGQSEVPTFFLAVQDARPLSNEIAERFQIKHESPQAILFFNKNAVWNTSHWHITKDSLSNATSGNN